MRGQLRAPLPVAVTCLRWVWGEVGESLSFSMLVPLSPLLSSQRHCSSLALDIGLPGPSRGGAVQDEVTFWNRTASSYVAPSWNSFPETQGGAGTGASLHLLPAFFSRLGA